MFNTVREAVSSLWINPEGGFNKGTENGFTVEMIQARLKAPRDIHQLRIEILQVLQSFRRKYGIQCGAVTSDKDGKAVYVIAINGDTKDGARIANRENQRVKAIIKESRINCLNSSDPDVRALGGVYRAMLTMIDEIEENILLLPEAFEDN
jgi:hypothetical protein